MVLSLVSITIVAAAALAGTFLLTKTRIEDQALQAKVAAQAAVLNGQEGQAIEVEANGFGGPMKVMVGIASDGTILGYEILEHSETPGLGDKAATWFKNADKPNQNIIGRKAGNLSVSKDGGEVDAITAATNVNHGSMNQLHMGTPGDLLIPTASSELRDKYAANNLEYAKYAVINPCEVIKAESPTYVSYGADLDTLLGDAAVQYICGKIDEDGLRAAWADWSNRGGELIKAEYTEVLAAQ